MSAPETVFVVGHEMGHYVLGHVWKSLVFVSVLLFGLFYLGFLSIDGLLRARGKKWGIRSTEDLASLPALLILFEAFSFFTTPALSAFSRYQEHQADQFGLEATHGLTPNSGQIAAHAFQTLGEIDLSEVTPEPLNVWLFFSHPSISDRVHFSLDYAPWSRGADPEFVK